MPQSTTPVYRIIFDQNDVTYELYARSISEEALLGFLELNELIFSKKSAFIDSTEEKLKAEFKGVRRVYIPMHAIFRIDEVASSGPARIQKHRDEQQAGNVWQFPTKKTSQEDTPA